MQCRTPDPIPVKENLARLAAVTSDLLLPLMGPIPPHTAPYRHRPRRWEVSTFDYIMGLNTLAGRSYCDLNQYPVSDEWEVSSEQ